MGKKNRRKNKTRIHCSKCGGKRLALLNKKKRIWECLDSRCGHKFMVMDQGTGTTYLALRKEDVEMLEDGPIPTETPSKEKDTVKEDANPLDDFLTDL